MTKLTGPLNCPFGARMAACLFINISNVVYLDQYPRFFTVMLYSIYNALIYPPEVRTAVTGLRWAPPVWNQG